MLGLRHGGVYRRVAQQQRGFGPLSHSRDSILDFRIRRCSALQLQRQQSTVSGHPQEPLSYTTSNSSQSHKGSYARRAVSWLFFSAVSFTLGFVITTAPAASSSQNLLKPPTDRETLSLFNPPPSSPAYDINAHITSHPLAQHLRALPGIVEARPHLKLPPSLRTHSFTAGTLMGPSMLEVPPLVFAARDGSRLVSIQYLGPALCGHPGIVHGGMLATMLDEGLARCCFPTLPNKVGVTASLTINYRRPCKAGQYVVLKAHTTKVEGRKAWVTGRVETLVDDPSTEQPVVLVEAEALFIEPKQAATMARVYSTQTDSPTGPAAAG